jgi:hypothetical protein
MNEVSRSRHSHERIVNTLGAASTGSALALPGRVPVPVPVERDEEAVRVLAGIGVPTAEILDQLLDLPRSSLHHGGP